MIDFTSCPKCGILLFVKNSIESNSYCFNKGCDYSEIGQLTPLHTQDMHRKVGGVLITEAKGRRFSTAAFPGRVNMIRYNEGRNY